MGDLLVGKPHFSGELDRDLHAAAPDLGCLHEPALEELRRYPDHADSVTALVALMSLLPVLTGVCEELVHGPVEVRDLRSAAGAVLSLFLVSGGFCLGCSRWRGSTSCRTTSGCGHGDGEQDSGALHR
jgi:hypothetical protein